jgi:hypothetical protein
MKQNITFTINMVKENNRKYNYPSKYIKKDGKLKKNMKKKIYEWRKDIKENYLNEEIYTNLKLKNLKLEESIKDYQEALETWVLIAQNKN